MDVVKVREMIQGDYAGVRLVDELTQREYHGSIWDRLSTVEKDAHLKSRRSEFRLNLQTGYCYVTVIKDKVIGFILAHETLPFRDTLYIRHIAVHPTYQGKGVGAMLYQAVIEKAKQMGVRKITALINVDNSKSISLHEKLNFELIDRKQAFLTIQ